MNTSHNLPKHVIGTQQQRRTRIRLVRPGAVFAALLLSLPSLKADYTTVIQPGTQWGTWEGWGCSLA